MNEFLLVLPKYHKVRKNRIKKLRKKRWQDVNDGLERQAKERSVDK